MRTELQNKAIKTAKAILDQYPWSNGVCLDTLPNTDEAILEKGFDVVVDDLVQDTIYWDGPTRI